MLRIFRVQVFGLIAAIIFCTTYAFASTQDNRALKSGEGTNQISGWNVSDLQYRLADDSPKISAVEFDLDGSADMVKVSINSSHTAFYDCKNSINTHWVCNIEPQMKISDADELRLIATGE